MSQDYTLPMILSDRELLRSMRKTLTDLEDETRAAIRVLSVEGLQAGSPEMFGKRLAFILYWRERVDHLEKLLAGCTALADEAQVTDQRIVEIGRKTGEITKRASVLLKSLVEIEVSAG